MKVELCDNCGSEVVYSKKRSTKFNPPEKALIDEMAPGRPMMPDGLRLVVFDETDVIRIMPRNARAAYLNIHRCNRR